MRDLQFFAIIFVLIALGMFGLYQAGTAFDYNLNCSDCPVSTPLSQYPDYRDKAIYFLTYIPLFIFNRLPLTFTNNTDINYAIGLIISFFIFFATIVLTYWLLHRLLAIIFKEDPTQGDHN